MLKRSILGVLAAGTILGAQAGAEDKWDSGYCNDDTATQTCNQLIHGASQTHSVQVVAGLRDQDWFRILTRLRHSFEARLSGSSHVQSAENSGGAGISGITLDRVNVSGTILTPGFAPEGTFSYPIIVAGRGWTAVRWIGTAEQFDFLRVLGPPAGVGASDVDQYNIEFLDTTLFAPRWSNAGSQITVFLVQNTSNQYVAGEIYFYNAAGALLHTQPFNSPVRGIAVVSTATIPALSGASGSAHIAHTGGWGALTGKAVALEPTTGFSFDTPFNTMPR